MKKKFYHLLNWLGKRIVIILVLLFIGLLAFSVFVFREKLTEFFQSEFFTNLIDPLSNFLIVLSTLIALLSAGIIKILKMNKKPEI